VLNLKKIIKILNRKILKIAFSEIVFDVIQIVNDIKKSILAKETIKTKE